MSRICGLALTLAACGAVPENRARLVPFDAGPDDAGMDQDAGIDQDAGPDDAGLQWDGDAGPPDDGVGPPDAGSSWDGDAGAPTFDVCNVCGPHVVPNVGIVDAGCNAGEVCMGIGPNESYPNSACMISENNEDPHCPPGYTVGGYDVYFRYDSPVSFDICLPPGGCQ